MFGAVVYNNQHDAFTPCLLFCTAMDQNDDREDKETERKMGGNNRTGLILGFTVGMIGTRKKKEKLTTLFRKKTKIKEKLIGLGLMWSRLRLILLG